MVVTSWGTAGSCNYGAIGNLCRRLPTCGPTETYSATWTCVPSNCLGRCENGGICDEAIGICVCPDNTYGANCQHNNCPDGSQVTCGGRGTCAVTESGLLYCACNTTGVQWEGPFCDQLPSGDPVCGQCTLYDDDTQQSPIGTFPCAVGDVFQITDGLDELCLVCPGDRCTVVIDTPVNSVCARPPAPTQCDQWH